MYFFELRVFNRKTADLLYFLILLIPSFSILDIIFQFTQRTIAFNFILGYIGYKFGGDVTVLGIIQMNISIAFFIILVYMFFSDDIMPFKEFFTLIIIAHIINFIRFIFPNQVTTKNEDMFKTPDWIQKLVVWFYGTPEDIEIFD